MVKDHEDKLRNENRCRHMSYYFRLAARVLLYASSHRQDNTYHISFLRSFLSAMETSMWARSKYADQSPTDGKGAFDAWHAVDGNHSNLSCTYIHTVESHPWWMVDLDRFIMITGVKLFNRVGM